MGSGAEENRDGTRGGADVRPGVEGDPRDDDRSEEQGPELDWWHRDHPVFAPLVGFYSGVLGVTVLPALYVGLLRSMMDFHEAERWFWCVALVLLVPLGMLLSHRTRRLGLYALLGMVTTVVVVAGVGGTVLWFLMRGA